MNPTAQAGGLSLALRAVQRQQAHVAAQRADFLH